MTDAVVALEGVRKSYGRGAAESQILRGLDLTLRRGEFAALIGPSGSGKSTLLNLLGLLDCPTGGVLRLGGQDVATLDERQITRLRGEAIGFVFQFHHLLPALSAVENVMLPLTLTAERTSRDALAEAQAMLDNVGLGDRARSSVRELSGGQQQRVAIARALVRRPALVLADEPTGNLDSSTSEEIFQLFRALHEQAGMTFVLITHDHDLAKACDRVITLVDGRIVADTGGWPSGQSGLR